MRIPFTIKTNQTSLNHHVIYVLKDIFGDACNSLLFPFFHKVDSSYRGRCLWPSSLHKWAPEKNIFSHNFLYGEAIKSFHLEETLSLYSTQIAIKRGLDFECMILEKSLNHISLWCVPSLDILAKYLFTFLARQLMPKIMNDHLSTPPHNYY